MANIDVSPSRWYYGLAVLVLMAGLAFFAWSLFSGITGIAGGLAHFEAPGTADLNLQESGSYTIFYESDSYINGSFRSTGENIPSLLIEIIELSTGTKVVTHPPTGSFTYNIGGRSGRAILAFLVNRPGTYRISASYPQGSKEPRIVLAAGHGFMEDIFSTVLTSMAAFFGSIVIAAATVIVIYKKRQRALERKREEERLIRGK